MTVLTTHEQQEIDRANNSGLQPVVFVHGLYLLSSSWDRWRALFEEQGYTTLAPGWPDDPETIAEANDDPEVFARKRIKQVTDHYADAIRQLKTRPAVIGHSFGGLIAQQLADEGLSAVTVARVSRRAAAASLRAQVRRTSPEQTRQLPSGRLTYLRAVPLRLYQCGGGRRSPRALRNVCGPRFRHARLPGRCRQPQPVDGRPGQHKEPRAWTTLAHRGRERPYCPVGGRHCCLQFAEKQSRCHGVPRNARSRAFTHHRPRVA